MQMAEPVRPRDMARRSKSPPRPRRWADLRFKPAPPVRWFSPGVLTGAGLRVLVSAAFGSYLDKRELQGTLPADSFSHRADAREVWLDFVADTGDGFAPTYSVAWLASKPELAVRGLPRPLPRGSLLVLGGDEVYPSGSPTAYENRFVGPYRAALPWVEEDPPELVALAGNHDWYDGLSSFVRLFCQGRWIGAHHTRQSRSYFAVMLPHRWWLWGIDIQFDTYLDDPQLKYFERVVTQEMHPGDRLILCTGKPSWTELRENPSAFRNLAFLERLLAGHQIRPLVTLTGDSHHYARYEGPGETQRITAGGGGAFLHGTHDLPERVVLDFDSESMPPATITCRARYPDPRRSRLLALGAVLLPWRNPSFMAVPAVVYLLLAWASQFGIRALGSSEPLPLDRAAPMFGLRDLAIGLLRNPNAVVLALVFLMGLIGFAKPPACFARGRRHLVAKAVMGTVHGAMHLMASLLVILLAIRVAATFADTGWFIFWHFALVALGGGLAGGLVMGIYLALCNLVPGREAHGNEAFSSMRLSCNKNFLRLHIDDEGLLHIYPIGIQRVTNRWELDSGNPDAGAPWLVPAGRAPEAHLIEAPIVIDGRPGAETAS